MPCWDSSHPEHNWPTINPGPFRILNCEYSCYYCSIQNNDKEEEDEGEWQQWWNTATRLRDHVQKQHLDMGEYPAVELLTDRPKSSGRRRVSLRTSLLETISAKETTKEKLDALNSLLYLKEDHHATFRRLVAGFLVFNGTRKESNTVPSQTVFAFLNAHAAHLWPSHPLHRQHLQRPISSPYSYWRKKTNVDGPVFVVDGRLSTKERAKWKDAREGRDPQVEDEVVESRLGLVMRLYMQAVLDATKHGASPMVDEDDLWLLRHEIVGVEVSREDRIAANRSERQRSLAAMLPASADSSPEIPLARVRRRDSSPEVPLALIFKKRMKLAVGQPIQSHPVEASAQLLSSTTGAPLCNSGTSQTASTGQSADDSRISGATCHSTVNIETVQGTREIQSQSMDRGPHGQQNEGPLEVLQQAALESTTPNQRTASPHQHPDQQRQSQRDDSIGLRTRAEPVNAPSLADTPTDEAAIPDDDDGLTVEERALLKQYMVATGWMGGLPLVSSSAEKEV